MEEIEIRQDLSHSYLVISAEEEQADFRIQMLAHQQMKELLPCKVRRINGELKLTYDISGKQSLRQRCEKDGIGRAQLESLFETICEACEHMRDYLLEAQMLLLAPEYIFCGKEDGFFFCCAPARPTSGYTDFHALCAFLLAHLEDADTAAAQLCCRLYKRSGQDDFRLAGELRRERTESISKSTEKPESISKSTKKPETDIAKTAQTMPRQEVQPQDEREAVKKQERRVKREKEKEKEKKRWPWQRETAMPQRALPAYAGEKLFAYGEKSCALHGKTKNLPVFAPAANPFLIGSLEFAVDGYIDDVTVSRFHAQLEKKEDGYYLTDLDSAHGTLINGKAIVPQTPTKLAGGDEITFGKAAFAFSV